MNFFRLMNYVHPVAAAGLPKIVINYSPNMQSHGVRTTQVFRVLTVVCLLINCSKWEQAAVISQDDNISV